MTLLDLSRSERATRARTWCSGLFLVVWVSACDARREISLFPQAPPDAGADARTASEGGSDRPSSGRCNTNLDCPDDKPSCDTSEKQCVECTSSSDCKQGRSCRFEEHICVATCAENADCSGGGRPICALSSGLCVECGSDRDCRDSQPYCELRTGRCVDCVDDADCDGLQTCVRGECER